MPSAKKYEDCELHTKYTTERGQWQKDNKLSKRELPMRKKRVSNSSTKGTKGTETLTRFPCSNLFQSFAVRILFRFVTITHLDLCDTGIQKGSSPVTVLNDPLEIWFSQIRSKRF